MSDGNLSIGFFSRADEVTPTFDPGTEVDCPVCDLPLSDKLKTISFLVAGTDRSYFYRTHRECYDSLNNDETAMVDGWHIDAVLAGNAGSPA